MHRSKYLFHWLSSCLELLATGLAGDTVRAVPCGCQPAPFLTIVHVAHDGLPDHSAAVRRQEFRCQCTSPNHLSVFDRDEYVIWGYSAHRDTLRIEGAADAIASEDARAAVLAQLADWNADLRYLVAHADASSLSSFVVKSSVPIPHWTTSRITPLGDALHNMTPYRGIGANTALRDAAVLRDALRDVLNGRRDLLGALSAYEEEMIKYGFAAVRASLAQMERLPTRSLTNRFATKVLFRILDLSPALRKRVLDLGG